jgi:hypothetical protein
MSEPFKVKGIESRVRMFKQLGGFKWEVVAVFIHFGRFLKTGYGFSDYGSKDLVFCWVDL